MSFTKPYSEETARQIDAEARRVIDEAYRMAKKVLEEHREGLKELAELLLQREVVFTEDVERIFGKRKKDIERERREAEAKAAGAASAPTSGSEVSSDTAAPASAATPTLHEDPAKSVSGEDAAATASSAPASSTDEKPSK